MDIEATDNATPNITSVGRSLSVMDATLTVITKDLGIHNAALTEALKAFQVLADAVRFAGAAQKLYKIAVDMTTASETAGGAVETDNLATKLADITTTDAQTASEWGLFAALEAVNAAMGPVGWLALGAGVAAGAVGGYALAGGFGGGTPASPGAETTNIYMSNVDMQTSANAEKTARDMATLYHQYRRRYGR